MFWNRDLLSLLTIKCYSRTKFFAVFGSDLTTRCLKRQTPEWQVVSLENWLKQIKLKNNSIFHQEQLHIVFFRRNCTMLSNIVFLWTSCERLCTNLKIISKNAWDPKFSHNEHFRMNSLAIMNVIRNKLCSFAMGFTIVIFITYLGSRILKS